MFVNFSGCKSILSYIKKGTCFLFQNDLKTNPISFHCNSIIENQGVFLGYKTLQGQCVGIQVGVNQ